MEFNFEEYERFYIPFYKKFTSQEWVDLPGQKIGEFSNKRWFAKNAKGQHLVQLYFNGHKPTGVESFYDIYLKLKKDKSQKHDIDDLAYYKALIYLLESKNTFLKIYRSRKWNYSSAGLSNRHNTMLATFPLEEQTDNIVIVKKNSPTIISQSKIALESYNSEFSELLVGPYNLLPKDVKCIVHLFDHFEEMDNTITTLFNQINAEREKPFFSSLKYRMIAYSWKGNQLVIHLTPITFAHIVVYGHYKDHEVYSSYFKNSLIAQTEMLKQKLDDENSVIYTDTDLSLLGIENCIITRDNFCLIRKKSQHSFLGENLWNSGLVGPVRLTNSEHVDLTESIMDDLKHRLSDSIPACVTKIRVTGLHRNIKTGATDILCYWRLDLTAQQLTKKIGLQEFKLGEIFPTQNSPNESFFSDTYNLLFPIDEKGQEISFEQNGIRYDQFVPESMMSMQIALNMC